MGKYTGSTFGSIIGKVGNSIGYVCKGQNIVRSLAAHVYNPRSPMQMAQRNAMKATVELSHLLAYAISVGFPSRPQKQSAYNAFVSENCSNSVSGYPDAARIVYSQVVVSKGSLLTPDIGEFKKSGTDSAMFEVKNNSNDTTAGQDDEVVAIALNELNNEVVKTIYSRTNSGEEELTFKHNVEDWSKIHLWAFAINPKGDKVSNTVYRQCKAA